MTVFVSLFTAFVVIIITVKKEALVLNVWCYCVSKKTCVCARFVNGPTGEETGRNGWLSAFHQQVRIVLSRVVAAVFPRTIFFFFLLVCLVGAASFTRANRDSVRTENG